MPRPCIAMNCHNSTQQGFMLFSFPKDRLMKEQWMTNSRNSYLGKKTKLCEKHFTEDQFEIGSEMARLKPTAVPTIFDFTIAKKQKKKKKPTEMSNSANYQACTKFQPNGKSTWKFNFQSMQTAAGASEYGDESPDIIVLDPPEPREPELIDLLQSFTEMSNKEKRPTDNIGEFPLSEIPDGGSQNNIDPEDCCNCNSSENVQMSTSMNHINDIHVPTSDLQQDSDNFSRERNSVSNNDLELLYKVADWLRLNKNQYESSCSALVSSCAHFALPLHFVPKIYPAKHISEQNAIYSCTIKIKRIVLAEDVSRDQQKALERAAKKACDLIMKHSICIETNERGVLCVRETPESSPIGKRKNSNCFSKNSSTSDETLKRTKRKKANPRRP